MKTDEWIDLLARNAGAAPRAVVARRLWPAAAVGLLASGAAALGFFGAIPGSMFATPVPWMKMAYAGALALAAAWLTARHARPAARTAGAARTTALVVLAMAVLGAVSLAAEPEGERLRALLGGSWATCAWRVLALSLPALAASLWALRGLAPTRPRAAGLAAGLLAGALGAFGYALSCLEASPAFVAVWYTQGIGLSGALGAALGPRVLRW